MLPSPEFGGHRRKFGHTFSRFVLGRTVAKKRKNIHHDFLHSNVKELFANFIFSDLIQALYDAAKKLNRSSAAGPATIALCYSTHLYY